MSKFISITAIVLTLISSILEIFPHVYKSSANWRIVNYAKISNIYNSISTSLLTLIASNTSFASVHGIDVKIPIIYEIHENGERESIYISQISSGGISLGVHDYVSFFIGSTKVSGILEERSYSYANENGYAIIKYKISLDYEGSQYLVNAKRNIVYSNDGKILTTNSPVDTYLYGKICEISRCEF